MGYFAGKLYWSDWPDWTQPKVVGHPWFWCPGCKSPHMVTVYLEGQPKPLPVAWTWNGNHESPTFGPSVNVNPNYPKKQCHFFVVNGQIRYQMDCWHDLRGTIADLPDWMDTEGMDWLE